MWASGLTNPERKANATRRRSTRDGCSWIARSLTVSIWRHFSLRAYGGPRGESQFSSRREVVIRLILVRQFVSAEPGVRLPIVPADGTDLALDRAMTEEFPPEHWANCAQQARALAEQMQAPECRKILLEIAVGYECMADAARRFRQYGGPL